MKRIPIFVLFLVLFPFVLSAQICKGKIVDGETGKALNYANIFLEGTLIGTTSDKNGTFELDIKGNHLHPIIVSFVGYETNILSFGEIEKNFIIKMKKSDFKVDEISVNSEPCPWSRKKMLRVFKEEFLGKSFNAQSCKIKNEDEIYLFYNKDSKTLHGHSKTPILIENRLLGYKVSYWLEYFRKSEEGVKFKGYNLFEELPFKNQKHKKNVFKQREETYYGSVMHIIRHLYHDDPLADDTIFQVRVLSKNNILVSEEIKILPADDKLVAYQSRLESNVFGEYFRNRFAFFDVLGNNLRNKDIKFLMDEKTELCFAKKIQILYYGKMNLSHMILRKDCVRIFENGYYSPESISWLGTVARSRVGDQLPLDYYPEE